MLSDNNISAACSTKKRSLKNVLRKFSRFSIVKNNADRQSQPIHPKTQSQDCWTKPYQRDDLATSAASTVDEDESVSAWSCTVDELMTSGRYSTLDEGSTRFTIPEYDAPLQLPMRQISKSSLCSCVLESSNRTDYSKYSFDDSFRSIGIDTSARSLATSCPQERS